MAVIKIHKGTPSGEHLCGTCRYSSYQRTVRGGERHYCKLNVLEVTDKIIECSNYDDKRLPHLNDMYDIAWIVRTDKSGKNIGFTRPGDDNHNPYGKPGF